MPRVGLRVAFLSSECEPWAKTGGLADVVDALARAVGGLRDDTIEGPVDVFLPRYRDVPDPRPDAVLGERIVAATAGGSGSLVCVGETGNVFRMTEADVERVESLVGAWHRSPSAARLAALPDARA